MSPIKKELEKHVEELEEQLKNCEDSSEEYIKRLKYSKAEVQNIQKQNQKRLQDVLDRANGSLLRQLIPLLDELKILGTEKGKREKLIEGVQMVGKKLEKILEMEGVQAIETSGAKFNPFKHDAIEEVVTHDFEEGYITEEIRRGYLYKDKVLRASLVKVARAPEIVEIKIEDDKDE